MKFSESKQEELISYSEKYYGAKDVIVAFIPSGDGMLLVNYGVDVVPNQTHLYDNIASILMVSRKLAEESGIPNTNVSVIATTMNGRGLGIGTYHSLPGETYYSSHGKTDIDVSTSLTGSENHLSPLRFQTFNRKVF